MNPSSSRKNSSSLLLVLTWAITCAFLLGSCQSIRDTIDHSKVQTKFEQCVQADNLRAVGGNAASGSSAKSCYKAVISSLKDLDTRQLSEGNQKGNAYLLLGMSQWRSGSYKDAITSSEQGLKQKGLTPGSRDTVLLTLLPALAVDSEIGESWRASGESLTPTQYSLIEDDYRSAFASVKRAEQAITPATTQGTIDFVYFQKARLVNNWRSVINSVGTSVQDRATPRDNASEVFGGKKLRVVMEEAQAKISSGSGFQNLFTK